LVAASSSTILTHLNWGTSYLVHDLYRRFIRPDAGERHYIVAARLVTVVLYVCAAGLTFVLDTARDAFDIMLQVGAGTGLLYLMRWFWWRVNAWCEVVAMVSSFAISVVFLALKHQQILHLSVHGQLLLTVAFTTVCWLLAAYFAPGTDRATLIRFYEQVRPFGPGWADIQREAKAADSRLRDVHESIPFCIVGWLCGTMFIWSALFTIGNFLYGRTGYAILLSCISLLSGAVMLFVIRKLWADDKSPDDDGREATVASSDGSIANTNSEEIN
jgi:hypothetical protein